MIKSTIKIFYEKYISPIQYRPRSLLNSPRIADKNEVSRYIPIYSANDDELLLHNQKWSTIFNRPVSNKNEYQNEAYVADLPRGVVYTGGWFDHAIITRKKRLLTDISWASIEKPDLTWEPIEHAEHPVFQRKHLPYLRSVSGQLAVVACSLVCSGNFYHWCYDLLPRLHLLRKSGISKKDCKYYMFQPIASYEKECLKRLNIRVEDIVDMRIRPAIKADHLLVTQHTRNGREHYPQWNMEFIRELFLPDRCPSLRVKDKPLIYISRKDGRTRRILNEDALIDELSNFGFSVFSMGELTLDEQAWLFYKAEVIVSAHGAALSHLAHSQPGTRVVALFAATFVFAWFSDMALRLKLDYRPLICTASPSKDWPGMHDDLIVDINSTVSAAMDSPIN